jgi:hypothetical protein
MPPVSYAVAWHHDHGPRLVGSVTVDVHGLVLVGRERGVQNGEERLAVAAGHVEHVELSRSSALPAIAAELDGRRVVIELLLGGWGAAHHLADALARPLAPPPASQRICTVAIAARILPGRRADLEELLDRGLPEELARDGVRCQEVSLGDDDLVVVVTGPEAIARRLSEIGLGLSGLISSPRLLTQTFSWIRGVPLSPVSR